MPWSSSSGWNNSGWASAASGAPAWVPPGSIAYYEFTTDRGYARSTVLASSTSDWSMSRASTGYDLLGATSFASNAFRRNSTGLLIEPAATNLFQWSQNINGVAVDATTIVGNAGTAPDGTTTSTQETPTAGTSEHGDYNVATATVAAATYSVTRMMKRISGLQSQYIHLGFATAGNANALWQEFDLTNGVKTANGGSIGTGSLTSSSILDCGSGWYACTIIGVLSSGSVSGYVSVFFTPSGGSATFNASFAGDTGSTYGHWGNQIEQTAFKTSYVPTLSASTATRAADAMSRTLEGGISTALYTFDDNSTQSIAASGSYTVPTSLNRSLIASVKFT